MAPKSGRWWLTEDGEQVVVAAPPDRIYELVADLPRMGQWSPECRRVKWVDGATGPAVGARFLGENRTGPGGLIRWSRGGRVLVADPGREFAFVTEEGGRESTVWRYQFEPVDGGTRVTESYEIRSLPWWARVLHIPTNRYRQLQEGLQRTLAHVKEAAEATSDSMGERP